MRPGTLARGACEHGVSSGHSAPERDFMSCLHRGKDRHRGVSLDACAQLHAGLQSSLDRQATILRSSALPSGTTAYR